MSHSQHPSTVRRSWRHCLRPLLVALVGATLLLAGAAPVSAAGPISATGPVELPLLPDAADARAHGVSSDGSIVGWSTVVPSYAQHATLWKPARGTGYTPVDLHPAGAQFSQASGINLSGVVAGAVDSHAEVWRPDGHGGHTPIALALLPGGAYGWALAIDPHGVVVGQTQASGGGFTFHATLWQPDGHGGYGAAVDLGTMGPDPSDSTAVAINRAGVVAGGSINAGFQFQAVVWKRGPGGTRTMTALDSAGAFSSAVGVDSAGVVAGNTGSPGPGVVWRPVPGGGYGAPSALPALPGGSWTYVNGISEAGVVAGTSIMDSFGRATVWVPTRDGGYSPIDLGLLPGGSVSGADAIAGDFVVGSSDVGALIGHPVVWRLSRR